MTVISNDVAAAGLTGSFVAGATALQLSSIGAQLTRGVQIKNPSTNAGTLYVGFASTVTAGTSTAATDGFQIEPGEKALIPIDNTDKIWLIASQASTYVSFLAV
jgi:hypothetical protein